MYNWFNIIVKLMDGRFDMIKLIAIDLGGTLLNDDNTISIANLEALNYAESNGIKIALATARMYSSTKYISELIKCDYGVFSNGSFVYDIKANHIIREQLLQTKAILKLIKFAKSKDIYLHLNHRFKEGSDTYDYFTMKHLLLNEQYPEKLKNNIFLVEDIITHVLDSNDILKLILVSEKPLDSVLNEITEILTEFNLNVTEYYKNLRETLIEKTINYIEIGQTMDTKFSGLCNLLEYLGFKREEILFIGDGENDYSMFKELDNTACMNNGSEKIKQLAKYVTINNNNNSGVAEAIYHFVR
ncbi:MAG: HAD-IIB family hydrolase [Bacilli bacterium]|nr:HAD-IIB family hydrolase [Bacilli bacterium]